MVKDSDQKQSARGGGAAQQQVIIHYTDGKDKMVYEDGASYQGQWKEGKKHGIGKFEKNVTYYEVDWKHYAEVPVKHPMVHLLSAFH